MSRPVAAQTLTDDRPLDLEMGGRLARLEIAYETWGRLSDARDNVVLVCPAFSAHAHAQSSAADPTPGWWEGMIGPGRAFDTDQFFVICPSLLGGSFGTTGPTSTDPETGKPYRGRFPAVTVRDIVAVHLRLLDHLGVERAHAAAGGSLGAMETLELGIRHPGRVDRVFAISGTDYTRPYTAAIRHLGRQAIILDPAFEGGEYEDGEGPSGGLRLAREIGTLYYRSPEEFNERFTHVPIAPPTSHGITFEVQSYLDYQGRKAVSMFDANSYLTLSLAMDLHDIWRGERSPDAVLRRGIDAAFRIVAVEGDRLISVAEQDHLNRLLSMADLDTELLVLQSPVGHDAFLAKSERRRMTKLVKHFIEG